MTPRADRLYSKPDEGSSNPDPTMQRPQGSPKGENMPPAGGESMSPAKDQPPVHETRDDDETEATPQ